MSYCRSTVAEKITNKNMQRQIEKLIRSCIALYRQIEKLIMDLKRDQIKAEASFSERQGKEKVSIGSEFCGGCHMIKLRRAHA